MIDPVSLSQSVHIVLGTVMLRFILLLYMQVHNSTIELALIPISKVFIISDPTKQLKSIVLQSNILIVMEKYIANWKVF